MHGSPHANLVKLVRNRMWYYINLQQFASRARINFGAVAKDNMSTFNKSKKTTTTYLFNAEKVSLGGLGHFELQY
jgi:hypothetical protein